MNRINSDNIVLIGGIDFSGASSISSQKKHIYLAYKNYKKNQFRVLNGFTRFTLLQYLEQLILEVMDKTSYAILGMDFSFAFPRGFMQKYTGNEKINYASILQLFSAESVQHFSAHQWSVRVNQYFTEHFHIEAGPFWGPSFKMQRRKPNFPFHQFFKEKRHCEELVPRTHSIFQLGGNGSVGLQSLHGIVFLKELTEFLVTRKIPVHIWPNMGLEIPSPPALLVLETYPGILNDDLKSDKNDALSIFDFLQNSFIFRGDYSNIMNYIAQNIPLSFLIEEGFLYGPIEKIFQDISEDRKS